MVLTRGGLSSGGTAPQVLKATQKTFMEFLRGHCHCALLLLPPNSPVGLMFLHCYDPVLCPPNSYNEALTPHTPERDCVWRWALKELNEASGVALVQSAWCPS